MTVGTKAPLAGPTNTEVLRSATALDEIREAWDALFARDPEAHAFQAWIPTIRLWQMERHEVEPRVIAVRSADGGLVALFALAIERRPHGPLVLSSLRPLAAPRYSHTHPLIDPAARAEAEDAVCAAFIDLSGEVDEVDIRFARHARWLTRPSPGIEAAATDVTTVETRIPRRVSRWDELLSRSSRYNIRRDSRLLRAAHPIHVTMLTTAGEVARWWPPFRLLHTTRSRAMGRRAYFEMGESPTRFAPMLLEMIEARLAEFHVMTSDDALVAGQIVFRHGGTAHSYRITFDEAFGRYGPGTLLQAEVMQRSIDLGDERFDFGHGHEAYKLRWGNERSRALQIHGGHGFRFRLAKGYSALAMTAARTGLIGSAHAEAQATTNEADA